MSAPSAHRGVLANAFLGAALAALFHSHLLITPLFQDDYGFLRKGFAAIAQHEPWSAILASSGEGVFWRPLSVGAYWHLASAWIGMHALPLHLVNLVVFFAAITTAGCLAAAIVQQLGAVPASRRQAALWGALLFGTHSAFFLPLAWASGIQELLALLFACLAMRAWIAMLGGDGWRGWLTPLWMLLAFLSKEGTAVLPGLFVVLTLLIRGWSRPARSVLAMWIGCVALTGAWLVVRSRFVSAAPPDSPYALAVGKNIVVNAAALGIFFLNVSREAMRFAAVDHSPTAMAWGGTCFALQSIALIIMARLAARRFEMRRVVWLTVFAAIAVGPYLFLVWNRYPYYMILSLVAVALLAGMAAERSRTFFIAAGLSLAASTLAIGGEYLAPYPATIARARWAESTLQMIGNVFRHAPADEHPFILMDIQDDNRCAAMGWKNGIVLRSGVPWNDVWVEDDPRPSANAFPDGIVYILHILPEGVELDKTTMEEAAERGIVE